MQQGGQKRKPGTVSDQLLNCVQRDLKKMNVQKQQHQTKMDGLKKNKLHINLAFDIHTNKQDNLHWCSSA